MPYLKPKLRFIVWWAYPTKWHVSYLERVGWELEDSGYNNNEKSWMGDIERWRRKRDNTPPGCPLRAEVHKHQCSTFIAQTKVMPSLPNLLKELVLGHSKEDQQKLTLADGRTLFWYQAFFVWDLHRFMNVVNELDYHRQGMRECNLHHMKLTLLKF